MLKGFALADGAVTRKNIASESTNVAA